MKSTITKKIIYSDGISFENLYEILKKEDIKLIKTQSIERELFDDSISIIFTNAQFLKENLKKLEELQTLSDIILFSTILVVENEKQLDFDIDVIDDIIQLPFNKPILLKKVKKSFTELYIKYESTILKKELEQRTKEIQELSKIGSMLMVEKDLNKLLFQILLKSREITNADAGSLYLIEEDEKKEKYLRFKLSQTYSLDTTYKEFTMPISKKSIAGYVAATGKSLNIKDVYEIPENKEYKFNKSFDVQFGYRTKSMLTTPLKNHIDEIIGVIQLINRKKSTEKLLKTPEDFEKEIIPFDEKCETLLYSLGGQAAVAIENNLLYQSIEKLFEGFVKASITAIEARDPTTSGHSQRVAILTVGIAEYVDRTKTGKYSDITFSKEQLKEIRYASLLHDFGKVGVRENVLVKAKKLYPHELKEILNRFIIIKKNIEIEKLNKKLDSFLKLDNKNYDEISHNIEIEYSNIIQEIDEFTKIVLRCNEPTVLDEDNLELLKRILEKTYIFQDTGELRLITPEEFKDLAIKKGSLNEEQRIEIESHVAHTFNFLSQVPWTKDLKGIPDIAYAHHEKLDGVGYPRKLYTEQIPLQSKMMTISDIFDALSASDRPYKKAVPYEKALDILNMDVKSNHLDKDLLDIFINAKIYEKVIKT
jgi:HD-GYP domain-containing protein (c-di-GMP phosphodiesterase class II)